MTLPPPLGDAYAVEHTASCPSSGPVPAAARDTSWLRDARRARWLAWASLVWMTIEGVVGLIAGFRAGSIALVSWALGSAVEGLASVIVIWRFSGTRTHSETSERRAQCGVAISFWLLAPYVAAEAAHDLLTSHHPETSVLGIALTAVALLEMPLLGRVKRRLGMRLDSAATIGEGRQNYVCAAQAGAVLIGLSVNAVWASGWWVDPVIALGIAAWAVVEGRDAWRGHACGC